MQKEVPLVRWACPEDRLEALEEKLLKSMLYGPGRAFNLFKSRTVCTYRRSVEQLRLPGLAA